MKTNLAKLVCLITCWTTPNHARDALTWTMLPSLPPGPGQKEQTGVAGSFAGVHDGALIVAGGANFPEAPPWRGGAKVWHDAIFVLDTAAGSPPVWHSADDLRLPRPLAYGVSVSTPEGIVCIGGCDADRCYADVFLLRRNRGERKVAIELLPSLPRSLAFMAGAVIGSTVYVAGGQETMVRARSTGSFYALDISKRYDPNGNVWRTLPSWPGPDRILPAAAVQSDGATDCFYLFSGRRVSPEDASEPLADAYSFNPRTERWKPLRAIAPQGEQPRPVMGAAACAAGVAHVVIFGGDDGTRFVESEGLGRAIEQAADPARRAALTAERIEGYEKHPGFRADILAYHTITDTYVRAGAFPTACPVTTTAVPSVGGFVLPGGEIRPGVRTPRVWKGMPPPKAGFGGANYGILGLYLAVLVGMGFYFSRREKTTDDFFKAGGRIPWWAAGLSIFGTQLSAITFMAIPAKTYATDWRYLTMNLTIPAVAPIVILVFLPFYRRLSVTTAYEYLERRFNLASRLIGSAMFCTLQFGRIGIVLFLPSIALSVVTGFDVRVCILLMGTLSTTYTVLGGIEAVIWTDVLQVIVLLGGAVFCLIRIAFSFGGGLPALLEVASNNDKLATLDFTFDLSAPTFWVVLLGGLAASCISYGSDQTVIQRYLTTRDERSAARGIWTNGLLCVPAAFLFFSIGTVLFAHYQRHPERLSPTLGNADAIFPWYMVTELPAPVAGLLVAAVFAAAMSSLDSSMNSVATAVTTDFYRRFRPTASDHACLALARWITVLVGAAGTLLALLMAGWGIQSLWDQLNVFLGLFAGGLGGLFLLGMLSRRAHGRGAVIGLIASGAVQVFVRYATDVSLLLYTFTGLASCLVIGYGASLVVPAPERSPDGLTIYGIASTGAPHGTPSDSS